MYFTVCINICKQRYKIHKCWRFPIFPGRHQPSIFGTTELNFCVRDGNRCTLSVINTNLFSLLSFDSFIIISPYFKKSNPFLEKIFNLEKFFILQLLLKNISKIYQKFIQIFNDILFNFCYNTDTDYLIS